MYVNIIAPLISVLVYSALLVATLRRSRRRIYRAFAGYLALMLVWSFGSIMMRFDFVPLDTLFWNRFIIATGMWMTLTYWLFVRTFTGKSAGKMVLFGCSLGLALTIFTWLGPVVRNAHVMDYVLINDLGPGSYGPTFYGAFFLILSLIYLVQNYRREQDPFVRSRLKYLLLGLSFVFVLGSTNLWPKIAGYPIDQLGNMANGLLVAYAILRYEFLDIGIALRRSMVYLGLATVFIATFVLLITFSQQLLHNTAKVSIIVAALVTILVIIATLQPLRNGIQRWIDKLFYGESYDHHRMLKESSQVMVTILDLPTLADRIVDLVSKTLRVEKVALFLLDGESYSPIALQGYPKLTKKELKLRSDNPVVKYLSRFNRFLTGNEINNKLPCKLGLWKEEEELLLSKLGIDLLFPLQARAQLTGLLMVGPKVSEDGYTLDEVELLSTVSGQMAIALDNARLYEESKRAYKELRVAHERLVRSEKLTALGVLSSGVAHDFNNMLTAILGRSQIALDRQKDPKVRRNLEIIEQAAVDAAGMVRKLQDFARVRTDITFDVVDISEILKSALEMIKPRLDERREAFGSGIEIALDVEETSPIKGDASELREALINIFINAIDAMPDGGKLNIRSTQDNGFVVISISDTGTGMTTEVRRRLFDPFFTTKGQNGLGMGLSVVYGVVKRHRGEIDVSSKPQKGSTFTIRIPVTEKHMEDITVEFNQNSTKNATILVVDDDKGSRDVLYEMLINNGCKVDIAGSGKEGLSLAQQKDYDILLVDLGMPDISGTELAAQVKATNPRTQIALVTGWGVQLDLSDLRERGITNVVAKPFTREEVLTIVRQLLSNQAQPNEPGTLVR